MASRKVWSMVRYGVPFAVLVALGVFLYRGLYLNPTLLDSPLIGKPAPTFSLPDLMDPSAQVSSADFGDRYVLVNVWATWCAECRREHSYLMQLADQGVPIYGIDWKEVHREDALEWLRVLGNPYTAVAEDQVGDVAIDFGVYGAPETFLVGPDKKIKTKQIGAMTPSVWQEKFVPLMRGAGEGG